MTLTEMSIGLGPYTDRLGFEIELRMDPDGAIFIKQGSDTVFLKDRNLCSAVMDAIDRLWASKAEVEKIPG